MKLKLNELMTIERILLEIDANYKFELDFNDAYTLYEYLKMVGKITSYAFFVQDEFYKRYNDKNKLEEYHNKIINCNIEFKEYDEVTKYIDEIEQKINNEKLTSLITNIKFWY